MYECQREERTAGERKREREERKRELECQSILLGHAEGDMTPTEGLDSSCLIPSATHENRYPGLR